MRLKLLTILICFGAVGNAQDYIPMLDKNHTWSVDVYYNPFLCECPYTVTQQVTVSGAIVIDGKTYMKVLNNFGETGCLVREENGIVYQRFEGGNDEFVKFNFTLEIGDSFNFFPEVLCSYSETGNTGIDFLEVINVDELFIAGEDRKVITFEDDNLGIGQEIWIEGVGSIRGFDSLGVVFDITDGTLLVCFDVNGENYFFNNATSCDNTTLGLPDLNRNSAVLFPNPVTSVSILQFASEADIDSVKIYNISGKLVKEEKVTSDYILIDAMEYRSGLYFYQLIYKTRVIHTAKFIIE